MFRSLLLLLPVLWFTSCPPDLEVPPALVTVEGFELSVDNGQGAATTDITEVWAFADGEFLGVFPLPARIPVFRLGQVTLRLEAGIRQDGRSVTPDIYPFYTPFVRTLELSSNATVNLGRLPIRYRPETVFGFVEGFEAGTPRVFTDRLAGNGELSVQTEVVRSGAAAGAISLADSNRLVELATFRTYGGLNELPINVWLEVDYLSDAPAVFGVVGEQGGLPVRVFDPGFLPRAEWTKIYFNLSSVVGAADVNEVRIALSALLGPELERGTVYLDNLKLLYLPAR
ncbi:hypothetical protein GGR26_003289 [Lewinella marina]|uniref:Uncharacterized protein n=1 Tax=Neolewinella marina TaxID=438751 RepID=A0A2G0CDZ8_9BACT|nr:hypothetical protein [Neolewinella marina]NJB87509.1 hypothetical protein [Neolewinella marina]PHK98185.1 hypothetical protein CGL56_10790 [Neolewinella marina]